jgi:Domain of unknown function (DUF4349)
MSITELSTSPRVGWIAAAIVVVAGILFVSAPNLLRSKLAANQASMIGRLKNATAFATTESPVRWTVQNGAIDLVVSNPVQVSERIRQLAADTGGFTVTSESRGANQDQSASMTIRVPQSQFAEVHEAIRKMGIRIEGEHFEAQDVTKQYVDQAARLRNLRAQEVQYLGILKQAKTVKDTIDVSEKLDEVRSEIEQQQVEFDALSKQVQTVALTITLRAEAEAQLFGLRWRPLYQLKFAARQGLDSVGDYAAAMASLLFYLPSVLLWLATILMGAAVGWRLLRWAGRALFVARPKAA